MIKAFGVFGPTLELNVVIMITKILCNIANINSDTAITKISEIQRVEIHCTLI